MSNFLFDPIMWIIPFAVALFVFFDLRRKIKLDYDRKIHKIYQDINSWYKRIMSIQPYEYEEAFRKSKSTCDSAIESLHKEPQEQVQKLKQELEEEKKNDPRKQSFLDKLLSFIYVFSLVSIVYIIIKIVTYIALQYDPAML